VGNPRRKPENLPAKLLAIRHKLEVSQSQMAKLLELENGAARVSEYEIGRREPDLMTLLQYSKLARVSLDVLADDNRELEV
jgi:transcriptional regulator with XRE-family HTH domain